MGGEYVSVRPTWDILAAFQEIARLDGAQDSDRQFTKELWLMRKM